MTHSDWSNLVTHTGCVSGACPGHDFLWRPSRHAKRVAKQRGIFKLTCIPTLLAAPLPKQYNTPTQFPPAAQAKSVVKSTTVKASTLTWFLHRKTTSISLRTTADSGIKQNRKDFISCLVHLQRRFPMHLPLCLPACRRLLFPLLHAMRESRIEITGIRDRAQKPLIG